MKVHTTHFERRDKVLLSLLAAGFGLAALLLWFVFRRGDLLTLFVVAIPLVFATQIGLFRGTLERIEELSQAQRRELGNAYRNIESLFSIFSFLRISAPLPAMREWAISPDFAKLIVESIRTRKPQLVVELGSGVSTLIAGYALKEAGSGTVISLDHDEHFAAVTKSNLSKHGLSRLAKVVHAPLHKVLLQGRTHLWYETGALAGLEDVDILIVDGPPGRLQELARFPALPLFWSHLRDNAVILVDDAGRADERKMVELWCREFPSLQIESIDTEVGALILTKENGTRPRLARGVEPPKTPGGRGFPRDSKVT